MDRILERTKAKQEAKLAMPVTFGAIDPLFAPKDPLAGDEQSDGEYYLVSCLLIQKDDFQELLQSLQKQTKMFKVWH